MSQAHGLSNLGVPARILQLLRAWAGRYDLLTLPEVESYRAIDGGYCGEFSTYSEYNYFASPLTAAVKRAHFEIALGAVAGRFGTTGALDIGCADGFFLPSLARHFGRVVAADIREDFVSAAAAVVQAEQLKNVEVVLNRPDDNTAVHHAMKGDPFGVAFALEVVEHVGDSAGEAYEGRIRFLESVFGLLAEDAVVVVSVPTMVGPAFLLQRMALAGFDMAREPLTWGQLFRAGLFSDTQELEKSWVGDHLGFNHLRLEEAFRGRFTVVQRRNLFFQMLYVLKA